MWKHEYVTEIQAIFHFEISRMTKSVNIDGSPAPSFSSKILKRPIHVQGTLYYRTVTLCDDIYKDRMWKHECVTEIKAFSNFATFRFIKMSTFTAPLPPVVQVKFSNVPYMFRAPCTTEL